MSSRAENEVVGYRTALEKALESDDAQEEIKDVLKALTAVPITIDILRRTKIGLTIQELKKKHAGDNIGAESKVLLSKWKKDCSGEQEKPKGEPAPSVKLVKGELKVEVKGEAAQKVEEKLEKPENAQASKSEEIDDNDDSHFQDSRFALLSLGRRNIMDMFAQRFHGQVSASFSNFIGFNVEASVNKLFNMDTDMKAYLNKAKSLNFNLKKNERLRQDLIGGIIDPGDLAFLSTNDLAADDVRGAREVVAKQAMLARRSDLYEITRNAMLQANGIDPDKGGEFTCRKCKGTKTSHYSLQTRSSDEPMTVFVECLGCGNRW
eukprot:CAMPEP_0173197668 /NCGR_PEP_ID=MMETSP1141-20130122/16286_1 /TAXON_ID=483371 /ORGANISM="non described non described, Strain CCMP2298" /LENGTH=320 /DNA_ID=CAMNT_0014122429 /DNA_START=26 /DNA_END=985 /DNA_ORIENTATION=-